MGPAQSLGACVEGWPGDLYAVLDGARLPDLRSRLSHMGLEAHSLFLERPGRPAPVSGPYIVALDRSGLRQLLTLPDIEQGCVLWSGPVQPALAYRHLRTLNTASIPSDSEPVLFRHWDPAVLALVVPLLAPEQLARLFGPFGRLALYSVDAQRPLWRPRPEGDAPPPRGLLKLSPAQMAEIEAAMHARSHRAIARYLRRNARDQTSGMDDAALGAFIAQAEREAQAWGVRTEAGLGRFAWLLLMTGGGLRQMAEARDFLLVGPMPSDARLTLLMRAVAARMRLGA